MGSCCYWMVSATLVKWALLFDSSCNELDCRSLETVSDLVVALDWCTYVGLPRVSPCRLHGSFSR